MQHTTHDASDEHVHDWSIMTYRIAEKFKSPQGEGIYTGTPMAFIRFVGCSVGKTICQHCDTDFDTILNWRGGGEFSDHELIEYVVRRPRYDHVCFTGGEPFDQDLENLIKAFIQLGVMVHIETSGTKKRPFGELGIQSSMLWTCVSPKPGFLEEVVMSADEVKVIVPGLGDINPKVPSHWAIQPFAECDGQLKRWPDITDALRWADAGKTVFLQPRNGKVEIDKNNLMYVLDLLREYPQLRISTQLHKILKVQ